jgi:hypothetical protein
MNKLLLTLVLTLGGCAGCATTQGPPVEVKIPVPVKCQTEDPTIPTYRFSPPYTTAFEAARDLLGDREVALAYENELRIALKSCK